MSNLIIISAIFVTVFSVLDVFSVSIPPSDDGFVDIVQGERMRGFDEKLAVRNVLHSDGQGDRYSYVRFDLSFIPADALILNATMLLFVERVLNPGLVNLHLVLEPWDEINLHAKSTPEILTKPISDFSIFRESQKKFISIDITGLFELWNNGSTPNYGVALLPDEFADVGVVFNSKENTETSHSPTIEVIIESSIDPSMEVEIPFITNENVTYLRNRRLGIGTDAPNALIDVLNGSIRASRNNDQFLELNGHTAEGGNIALFSTESNKKKLSFKSLHNNNGKPSGQTGFKFLLGSQENPREVLNIQEDGKVGIGLSMIPRHTLDVNGVIGIKGKPVIDLDGTWIGSLSPASVVSDSIARGSIESHHLSAMVMNSLAHQVLFMLELKRDLLLYYSFNSIQGDKVFDESGNRLDGVNNGAISISDGIFGNAMRFDGFRHFIDVGTPQSLNLTNSFSIVSWVRLIDPRDVEGSAVSRDIIGQRQFSLGTRGSPWRKRNSIL